MGGGEELEAKPSKWWRARVCLSNTADNLFPGSNRHTEEDGKGEEKEEEGRKMLRFDWQKEEQNLEASEFPKDPTKLSLTFPIPVTLPAGLWLCLYSLNSPIF